jgi:hypothetical protein
MPGVRRAALLSIRRPSRSSRRAVLTGSDGRLGSSSTGVYARHSVFGTGAAASETVRLGGASPRDGCNSSARLVAVQAAVSAGTSSSTFFRSFSSSSDSREYALRSRRPTSHASSCSILSRRRA